MNKSENTLTSVYSGNNLYIYRDDTGRQVTVIIDRSLGVTVHDSKYGEITESNFVVFSTLYPSIAPFFAEKVVWKV